VNQVNDGMMTLKIIVT